MSFIIFEILFFAILLVGDLVSKHYVVPFLMDNGGYYPLIEDVLSLKLSFNDGAGFSILSGRTGLLIGFTAVAMVLIFLFLIFLHFKKAHKAPKERFLVCSIVMILAGGIGNLYDRIANAGLVRDFIEYTFVETLFGKSFAICNLADVWLTLGMLFIVVYIIFMYKEKKTVEPVEPDDDYSNDGVSEALELLDKKDNSENNIQEDNNSQEDNI